MTRLMSAAHESGHNLSPNIVLIVVIAVLFAAGFYLILERSLTRILVGIVLMGNGVNLLILELGGAAGGPPFVGRTPENEMADPLPQALVLTAIVITLGMTAFLLAMAYRSWQLHGHDEVQDDVEDRLVARLAEREDDGDDSGHWLDDAAESLRDETENAGDDHPRTTPDKGEAR